MNSPALPRVVAEIIFWKLPNVVRIGYKKEPSLLGWWNNIRELQNAARSANYEKHTCNEDESLIATISIHAERRWSSKSEIRVKPLVRSIDCNEVHVPNFIAPALIVNESANAF